MNNLLRVSIPVLHHQLDVCACFRCSVQCFYFAWFYFIFFFLLLLHCWVLGRCLVLLCVVLWVVWIHPWLPCPGRGKVHMRPASIGSLQQAAFAVIRLTWGRCNSELSSCGVSGLLVRCRLVSLTPWHSCPGICFAVLPLAFHTLFIKKKPTKNCCAAKSCTWSVF